MYASMPPLKVALEGRKVPYPGGRVRGEKGAGIVDSCPVLRAKRRQFAVTSDRGKKCTGSLQKKSLLVNKFNTFVSII